MIVKSITKEEVQKLPLIAFEGEIYTIDSFSDVIKAVNYLEKQTILGFDTETRPCFSKGKRNEVALLQLSTEKYAFLFRLNNIGLPKELAKILANEKILKIGVALKDDVLALKKITNFEPQGFIDLQTYVKTFEIENFGLKSLSALVLGFKISKNQQVSNWEATTLTDAQKRYAATDAWVSLKIYQKLKEQEINTLI